MNKMCFLLDETLFHQILKKILASQKNVDEVNNFSFY